MPAEESNLAERSGSLVEANEGYDPRLIAFYPIVAVLLLTLIGGLAYQQLNRAGLHHQSERRQDDRRLIYPGPRGNIYDREHRLLVGNRPRLAVVLYLDDLRHEYQETKRTIVRAYQASAPTNALGKKVTDDLPTGEQYNAIAWHAVVQKYMDQVDELLGRTDKVDTKSLDEHMRQMLLPYTLIDDLKPDEYAKIVEKVPVTSPLHLYTTNTRYYPYKSAASHVLGYVQANDKLIDEDFPGDDLRSFQMKSTVGKDGLEETFDSQLQGEAGYAIVKIDFQGFQVSQPLLSARPKQGKNLVTSIDVDLQKAAEDAIGDYSGAAVAMDVHTGEVLVLASKPDYDLNDFAPRIKKDVYQKALDDGGLLNRATQGYYPPGSTFKIIASIAGMRDAGLSPTDWTADCDGSIMIGNRAYKCDNGEGHHGVLNLPGAITTSCDVFFYEWGMATGPDNLAAEARRFHLDRPTGIEIPESNRMIVPDPAWKAAHRHEDGQWRRSDTAMMGIGQSYLAESPMIMCCFAASLARGETTTVPTLLHDPDRPTQHTEPIGLTAAQTAAIRDGMIGVTHDSPLRGTASLLTTMDSMKLPCEIAGKTGTAQVTVKDKDTKELRHTDIAWFICYAPVDNPEIAVAVAVEGDTSGGESFGGAQHSAPVADAILQAYFDKKAHPHQMLKTQMASNP